MIMMLRRAASYFNRTPCTDAYTGQVLFNCQLQPFDDAKRDAVVTERRIMSLAPEIVPPPRRVVSAAGLNYIIGHGTPDQYRGRTIRVGYVAQEAPFTVTVRTLAQACNGDAGFTAWGNRDWVKNLALVDQTSELPEQVHITLAHGEPVEESMLLMLGGRYYLSRQIIPLSPTGMLVVLCDEQPDPVIEEVAVPSGTYNPVTETWTALTAPRRIVRLRWRSLFTYGTKVAPAYGPDDIQVVMTGDAPREGSMLGLSDGQWMLADVTLHRGVWLCRATRHG